MHGLCAELQTRCDWAAGALSGQPQACRLHAVSDSTDEGYLISCSEVADPVVARAVLRFTS
jgi:hypothetical protein